MESGATVSLANADEITGSSEYGGWESAMGSPPARKKGEPEESGREVSYKREHGRQKQQIVSV